MKRRKLLTISVFFLLALALAAGFFCTRIGYLLSKDDELGKADAILVLSGSLAERPLYAADLFHKRYADHIYLSRSVESRPLLERLGIVLPSELAVNQMVFSKRGVPADRITASPLASQSTAEEALVFQTVLPRQYRKLIVVTSPYHVFRTRLIFTDRFPDHDIMVVGTPYSSFQKKWWTDQGSAMMVIYEILKTGFYYSGGRYIHNETVWK